MVAARLRDLVVFQEEREEDDGAGGYALVWRTVWSGKGHLNLEGALERVEAGRLEGSTRGVLSVRSSVMTRSITPEHRCLIRGEPYQVRSNDNRDRRRRWQVMIVERGVAT